MRSNLVKETIRQVMTPVYAKKLAKKILSTSNMVSIEAGSETVTDNFHQISLQQRTAEKSRLRSMRVKIFFNLNSNYFFFF